MKENVGTKWMNCEVGAKMNVRGVSFKKDLQKWHGVKWDGEEPATLMSVRIEPDDNIRNRKPGRIWMKAMGRTKMNEKVVWDENERKCQWRKWMNDEPIAKINEPGGGD